MFSNDSKSLVPAENYGLAALWFLFSMVTIIGAVIAALNARFDVMVGLFSLGTLLAAVGGQRVKRLQVEQATYLKVVRSLALLIAIAPIIARLVVQ